MIVLIHERKWLRGIVEILMHFREKYEFFMTNELNVVNGTAILWN